VDYVYRTQISDQKQAVVKMSIKLRDPDNVEKSLISFFGRILFSGVSLSCILWTDHKLSFICHTGNSGLHYWLAVCV